MCPQGDAQVEPTNKVIGQLFIKLVNENLANWNEYLPIVLFSYRTIYKVITSHIPFQLVYGLHPLMPTKYLVPIKRTNGELNYIPTQVLTTRLVDLEQMDSMHMYSQ
jgi:hypothetical protein